MDFTFFKNLNMCKHHKECRYIDKRPESYCVNGGGNYCGVYREWSTRRLEALSNGGIKQ